MFLQILGEVANICLRDFRHFKDRLFSIFAMAAAGVLRASNRSPPSGQGFLVLSSLRVSAENRIVCGTGFYF